MVDENGTNGRLWRDKCNSVEKERDALRKHVEALTEANSYSSGYIARVKETDAHFQPDPT